VIGHAGTQTLKRKIEIDKRHGVGRSTTDKHRQIRQLHWLFEAWCF